MANRIPDKFVSSPAAWLGPQQSKRSDWIHVLSDAENAELDSAIQAYRRMGKALREISASDYPLPVLGPAIAAWMRELDDGRGFFLVRGFPAADHTEAEASFAYWLIGLQMGCPVPQNRKGDALGHVRDDGADPTQPGIRLYRTRMKLDFHTDGADIIGLMCLNRAKSGGLSRIASSVSIFNELMRRRPDLAPLLFENFFWDREAEAGPGEPRYFNFPICRYENGRLGTFYIGWYIRNAQRFPEVPRLTAAQTELLDLIDTIANDPAFYQEMDFEPGDMQFLKNAVILHARTEYEDWKEPERKRHLLRLWLTNFTFKDGDPQMREGIRAASGAIQGERRKQS
ncbi:MAG: TauD/TfdA family dioxygenase [Candidatus Binatus sp.]